MKYNSDRRRYTQTEGYTNSHTGKHTIRQTVIDTETYRQTHTDLQIDKNTEICIQIDCKNSATNLVVCGKGDVYKSSTAAVIGRPVSSPSRCLFEASDAVDVDRRLIERYDEKDVRVGAVAETDRESRIGDEDLPEVEVAVEEEDSIVSGVGDDDASV